MHSMHLPPERAGNGDPLARRKVAPASRECKYGGASNHDDVLSTPELISDRGGNDITAGMK